MWHFNHQYAIKSITIDGWAGFKAIVWQHLGTYVGREPYWKTHIFTDNIKQTCNILIGALQICMMADLAKIPKRSPPYVFPFLSSQVEEGGS